MGDVGDFLGGIIVAFIVSIIIFLICRELNCWYWKINAHLKLMEDINSKLAAISERLSRPSSTANEGLKETGEISCPQCKQNTAASGAFCENCGYKLT